MAAEHFRQFVASRERFPRLALTSCFVLDGAGYGISSEPLVIEEIAWTYAPQSPGKPASR